MARHLGVHALLEVHHPCRQRLQLHPAVLGELGVAVAGEVDLGVVAGELQQEPLLQAGPGAPRDRWRFGSGNQLSTGFQGEAGAWESPWARKVGKPE